jgi:hypothetical protein
MKGNTLFTGLINFFKGLVVAFIFFTLAACGSASLPDISCPVILLNGDATLR